jgi:hypothetical protein
MNQCILNPPLEEAASSSHPQPSGGWLDGPPVHVPGDVVLADVRIYRNARCTACRRRRLHVLPQHHGLTNATASWVAAATAARNRFSKPQPLHPRHPPGAEPRGSAPFS